MGLFGKRNRQKETEECVTDGFAKALQTGGTGMHPYAGLRSVSPLAKESHALYDELRLAVPIIDAGIHKIIRLVGGFHLESENEEAESILDSFLHHVLYEHGHGGFRSFLYTYLSDILTYGNACGEIVPNEAENAVFGIYNVPLSRMFVQQDKSGVELSFFVRDGKELREIAEPGRMLFSALNPKSGEVTGHSILEGLPFLSNILMKIFYATEQNFDRVGNVRFAVSYLPDGEANGAVLKERAKLVAKEWADAMRADRVRDFVTLGDVKIQTIGADNQVLETQVPVRQILEQIVAKLGLPPYLLGLSWSTTERMSSVQADILTSELASFREVLTPVIWKICKTHLLLKGCYADFRVIWEDINLQDEVEGANARLLHAQAEAVELSNEKMKQEGKT